MRIPSTVSLKAIQNIAASYQLLVQQFAPLGAGSANLNFLLDTDRGKVALSIFEEQTPEEVNTMAKLLVWLEKHQFHTSRLFFTSHGKMTVRHGQKAVFLKNYISGKTCFELTDAMLEQVGTAMGHLHEIPVPDYLPTTNYYESPMFSKVIGLGIDTEYEAWLEERTIFLEKHLSKEVPRGLIHGDVFANNVLFEKGKLKAIIDFELACNYYKVFDIGMAIIGLCTEKNNIVSKKVSALVRGYQQVRQLDDKEKQSLQGYAEMAAVKTANWRFWRYRYYQPNPELRYKCTEMRQLAKSIEAISKNTFISTIFN